MKKRWSNKWVGSKQPRKQRKYRYNAPIHIRKKFLGANLSKILRRQYKKRTVKVRSGDVVKIMRGRYKGQTGEITDVDVRKTKMYIKGIVRKKVSGTEVQIPINPSNVQIIELNLDDAKRGLSSKKGEKE